MAPGKLGARATPFAPIVSTYAVQTLGFAAYGERNIIRMGAIRLGVEEACSGLSMLLIFLAVCTAVAIFVLRYLFGVDDSARAG
jgi:hypothetical protein